MENIRNKMAQAAIPETVRGKASEISRKAMRTEASFIPTNKVLVDTAIDYVDDNDKQQWVNAFTLKNNTYRLPTIVCRGNPEKPHKMTSSISQVFQSGNILLHQPSNSNY